MKITVCTSCIRFYISRDFKAEKTIYFSKKRILFLFYLYLDTLGIKSYNILNQIRHGGFREKQDKRVCILSIKI